jgi:dihydroorotate dehydrogenase
MLFVRKRENFTHARLQRKLACHWISLVTVNINTMNYALLRKLLFLFNPELSHVLALQALKVAHRLRLLHLLAKPMASPCKVMGIDFPNPVGLAAGLDKNGDYIDALGMLGFGFIEVGTVTPKPQAGNPKPRLFRIPQRQAIINRMGFNNKGVDYLCQRLQQMRYQGVLGINIGKNKTTPVDQALADYLLCLRKVYLYADYITINISSPNTPGLRELQYGQHLASLLEGLKQTQHQLQQQHQRYVPIVIKVAPDLTEAEIQQVASYLLHYAMDGVIATNTTLSREGVQDLPGAEQAGGLSGQPLLEKSNRVVNKFATLLANKIPIIGVGGITHAKHAQTKMTAGASLVQIYTGLIYQGPNLICQCVKSCASHQ